MMTKMIPVILVGGSGSRLWPLSRTNDPKQFAIFSGEYSLFQKTVLRLRAINHVERMIVIVGESNYFLCLTQLRALEIHNVDIIVEPMGRNTAPAVAVAAVHIEKHYGKDVRMLVLPSDHEIFSAEKFVETVQAAVSKTQDSLVLFGVVPTVPSTAYGYIKVKKGEHFPAAVAQFIEKPVLEKAKTLLAEGGCYWNSGMFFFSVTAILAEFQLYAEDILKTAKLSLSKGLQQGNTFYLNAEAFSTIPNLPLDIAIMEKTQKAAVFPLKSDWSDLGDWEAIYQSQLHARDDHNNVQVGNVISLSAKNSYLHSKHALLTTVGVENLVVVATKDSVLVANRDCVQDVKKLVETLKSSEYANHAHEDVKVYRPWGSYESVVNLDNFKVKHIIVKPGGKLSLQQHAHRSEHWIVVRGVAEVVCDDQQFQVHENESTYIPKQTKHRLMNLQETPLHLIEVQVGGYLGEDDIVRFDDIYGR